jgi:5,10-methylenetetrahydrofolate reductase
MAHISFEYFPPKTSEQQAILQDTHQALQALEDLKTVAQRRGKSVEELSA